MEKRIWAKTRPVAKAENTVFWRDYRVTVLGERLFRIEKSAKKKFRDEATQVVWYRDAEKQEFSVKISGDRAEITTAACSLVLRAKRKDCVLSFGGEHIKICNKGNLKGTFRTLDGCDGENHVFDVGYGLGKVALCAGVCSTTGVAVLSDGESLSLSEDGEILAEKGDGSDEYVFAFGKDYRGAVRALYGITGHTPLVPRFALGNWWSRYHAYTQEEYMRVMHRFKNNDVPITVATIDMDWHWSDFVDKQKGITASGRNTAYYCGKSRNYGWTGYSWNTELFPDHKQMLAELKDMGLKVTLNVHPADGVRFWEDMYDEAAKTMGVDPADGKAIAFDLTDPKYIDLYFRLLHRPYEKEGVDFWWIDWQQGTETKMKGLDPLWVLNHYHYCDRAENTATPLILSRYAGIGSHRYPLGFSGDTVISWKTLAYLPYFTLTASNVGYTWWSHDIGGHHSGEKNDELYIRHLQFGVFSPVNRLHCTSTPIMNKEPWLYGNGAGEIAKKWLRFRHSLIPFLYTKSYETHKYGTPLTEPLYYAYDAPEAYEYKNEYIFGGSLLVAPVTRKRRKDGYARTEVWIPEGEWTDIFTGERYVAGKGGKNATLLRTLDTIPVLIGKGGILPLSLDNGNSCDLPEKLLVRVWNGDGSFDLYEDGMERGNDKQLFTCFTSEYSEKNGKATQTLRIKATGEKSLVKERMVKVVFENAADGEITVYKDGKEIGKGERYADKPTAEFGWDADSVYTVALAFRPKSESDLVKESVLNLLTRAEGDNQTKNLLWEKTEKCGSVKEIAEVFSSGDVPEAIKEKIAEYL